MRIAPLCALLAPALASALFAAPAQATQRARVFVASYGSDTNPCTFGSPCKTFQNALLAVAPGGEITAIDSAGFGPVTINQAVTITSPAGVEAGIAAAAGNSAIIVNAGSNDTVVLRGLTLEGAAIASNGIQYNSGGKLEVVNCIIRNYTSDGIFVNPANAATLLISNTIISDQGSAGVDISGIGANLIAALDHVTIENNHVGMYALGGGSAAVEVSVANSQINNNSFGIVSSGASSSFVASVILTNVTLNQTVTNIDVEQNSSIWLSHVQQTNDASVGGPVGVKFETGGSGNQTVFSDGTNLLTAGVSNGMLTAWTKQ